LSPKSEIKIIIFTIDGKKMIDVFKGEDYLPLFTDEQFDKVTVYEEER